MNLVALPILVTVLVSAIKYFQGNDYYAPDEWPQDVPINNLLKEYDFIVVGSGSAGLHFLFFKFLFYVKFNLGAVVASRLSEVEQWNVLLVEAGEMPPIETDVPLMKTSDMGTDYNWNYVTESQEYAYQGNHYFNPFSHIVCYIFFYNSTVSIKMNKMI